MVSPDNIKYFFGQHARFEHAGIAVPSISNAVQGVNKTEDPLQNVNVAFIHIHDIKIELIEPKSKKSPVQNILHKGQSLYHLCFSVPDIDEALATARKHGFHRISRPVPAKAFSDKRIAWVFSRNFGLFELVETASSAD